MAGLRRALVALCTIGTLATLGVAGAGGSAGAAKANTEWRVGDCFTKADVDADMVDLSSKVPCTKVHAVQVVRGAPLPANLVSAGLTTLVNQSVTSLRSQLNQLAAITCNAGNLAPEVYPKLGKKLQPLMLSEDVTEFLPASPGRGGWVLPDAASFAAGTTDLLCVWQPDRTVKGATTADIRKIESRSAPLSMRICQDFKADNSGADSASCAKKHDVEQLIYVSKIVTGKPANVSTWTDADWAPYDASCAKFADVLIGASRSDLVIRADANPAESVVQGRRMIICRAYTEDEKLALPAGTLVGAGKTKISFPKV